MRLDDRAKTWSAPDGLKGTQTELSASDIAALRAGNKGLAKKEVDKTDKPDAAAAEAERRRQKNFKKKQAKARKELTAGIEELTATDATTEVPIDTSSVNLAAAAEVVVGEKRKSIPE